MSVHSNQCLQGIIVPFIHSKKKGTNFFPSSAPPQEDKCKLQKKKKSTNLPTSFSHLLPNSWKPPVSLFSPPTYLKDTALHLLTLCKISSFPASEKLECSFLKVSDQACILKGSHKNKTQTLLSRSTVPHCFVPAPYPCQMEAAHIPLYPSPEGQP